MSETLSVLEPATEQVLQTLPRAGVEETDEAVARATGGRPAWRGLPPGPPPGDPRRPTAAPEDADAKHAMWLRAVERSRGWAPSDVEV